jgi:Rieske Fe-S protein
MDNRKTQQTAECAITNGEDSAMNRRTFCNRLLWTSAGMALAAKELNGRTIGQQPRRHDLLSYPPVRIDGAERVLPGAYLYFNYPKPDDPAILLRSAEGEYFAYSRKCAHLGCSIEFDGAGRRLMCPCHRGAYDSRTGYVIYGPPPRPLDQIVLQMRAGGEVWAVGRRSGGDLNAEVPRLGAPAPPSTRD